MLATLVCSLIPPLHYEIGSRSVHWELSIQNRFHEKKSIQSPAKCKICSIIRYLVWKRKTPVEVYNKVKTAFGDKAMNRTRVVRWCGELKTVVRMPMVLRGVEDLQLWNEIENALREDRRLTVDELSAMSPQISRSLLHETLGYGNCSRGGSQNNWQTNTSWIE